MNRADLSRLLGECFSLLEDREATVALPGTKADGTTDLAIRLPENLYVVGTMNLIDQSVEQIDFALRRRFLWIECPFSADDLLAVCRAKWERDPAPYHPWDRVAPDFQRLRAAATALNAAVRASAALGPQYEIGHTYFFDVVRFLRDELSGANRARKYVLWRKGEPEGPVRALWQLALLPLLREYLAGLDARTREAEVARLERVFLHPPVDADA
jgi:5-methylcytosine-specific restriction protein B